MPKFIVFKTKFSSAFARQLAEFKFVEAEDSEEAEQIASDYPEGDPSDYFAFEFTELWQSVADEIQKHNPKLV